ncbi:MAG TPA: 5'-3' exonuclease H3TH domain-containing protein [Tahibacter sp.]|uniref:5'-3' exonuclease n=1 Tax=Tahibacter sp. TaxID=2056211 RepID=UPI002B941E9B|nr:5'-3' exonuclease H3TH domain-containing protein [Tahibacter sp.]HSX59307.1 5'-3' exonuclease H3TH domain-containing protein [Tahibacter sp.]
MDRSTIHLVDASLYVFRAWHSVPPEFFDVDGRPVNAVYGFTRFLLDLIERAKPSHCGVAFDESLTSSFRNGIYPEYKANRELPPEELKVQFAYCQRIAAALGLRVLSDVSFEADDLIGSVVHALRPQQFRAVIVSADKDFGQLVGEHDEIWDFSKNQSWNGAGVKERLGVHPHQVADYLALTGDAIDNIPGVAGIGAKTAATLLGHFGSLDAIYARIEEIPFLRFRGAAAAYAKLKAGAALARLSRSLTGIACDCPVPADATSFVRGKPDLADVDGLLEQLRFGPLTRSRIRALA